MVQYVTSLYWAAATSASVGYGDIHAMLVSEVRNVTRDGWVGTGGKSRG